jgi:hypothetical protein
MSQVYLDDQRIYDRETSLRGLVQPSNETLAYPTILKQYRCESGVFPREIFENSNVNIRTEVAIVQIKDYVERKSRRRGF